MALAAQASKSPFAALLKRSKFSTFDPKIAQVYTTHGGDAHRGNWGFKRPLPLRRRGAYITVRAVDSLEKQTEWNSAEPQASWMKNWDELQFNPTNQNSLVPTTRSERNDTTTGADIADSEYAPDQSNPLEWRSPAIPNIHAMSNNEFEQYLVHISRQREAFFKYKVEQLEKAEAAKKAKATERENAEAVTEISEGATKTRRKKKKLPFVIDPARLEYYLDEFATWESQKRRENHHSHSLESLPHPSSGLHYSNFTPLQTYLSTKERKGRLVEEVRGDKGRPLYYVASYAGMGTVVQQKKQGVMSPMVWGDASKTGATKFRPESVTLHRAPEVVGKRQGLKAAKISVEASAWDAESHYKSNSHRPGSLEYITSEPTKTFSHNFNLTTKRKYDSILKKANGQGKPEEGIPSRKTIDILEGILKEKS
ncbi:hypothetical protein K503DRAFT_481685 [Rhizopogon vinicolor AM-OR11-026]|uniref:Uncharacterized protein n=1 Tax=Rhizopogon vinicolor AM-OR11-026 TaxID=1314800 RepID=A0A1B7N9Q3_9AGAM|nr:hypothetical protein K503DRAFT_481685 [Rhizopogon vinicolor AM-OR11-026]